MTRPDIKIYGIDKNILRKCKWAYTDQQRKTNISFHQKNPLSLITAVLKLFY
jgi:hypothetical protein